MKTILALGAALAALPVLSVPAWAGVDSLQSPPAWAAPALGDEAFDRRGRGRGRGGDDRAGDDSRGGGSGGHGGRPRIPGGSGCDDPEDILEHPECRV